MVFLNDLLASGNIPDVFTKELKDEFSNAVRNEAKQAGLQVCVCFCMNPYFSYVCIILLPWYV
jgi:hypothetical protein